jgi:hypothetical protein
MPNTATTPLGAYAGLMSEHESVLSRVERTGTDLGTTASEDATLLEEVVSPEVLLVAVPPPEAGIAESYKPGSEDDDFDWDEDVEPTRRASRPYPVPMAGAPASLASAQK